MVFDTYHIIYLLAIFFLIFVVHRFMRVFFEHRKYKRILGILAYSFYFIMTTLVYLLIDIPLITLITNLITMFIISLTYEASIQKKNYLCCLHVSFYGSSGNNCGSYDWIY